MWLIRYWLNKWDDIWNNWSLPTTYMCWSQDFTAQYRQNLPCWDSHLSHCRPVDSLGSLFVAWRCDCTVCVMTLRTYLTVHCCMPKGNRQRWAKCPCTASTYSTQNAYTHLYGHADVHCKTNWPPTAQSLTGSILETLLQVRSMQARQTGSVLKVREAAAAAPCLRKHHMDLLRYLSPECTSVRDLPVNSLICFLQHQEASNLDSIILEWL